jgi:phosphoglycolate phosphatase
MNLKQINTIVWDWNGTLLNDIDICLVAINKLLQERNLQALDKNDYKDIFTFPVRKYYEKAGFDFTKESFDKIAVDFMDLYHQQLAVASIFDEAKPILKQFQSNDYRQIMISAMEHESLLKTVREKGIFNYFDRISGIEDIYANSKVENAKTIFDELDLIPGEVCLIGDTIHDFEVARELGSLCILISNGHQSFTRLQQSEAITLKNLNEIPDIFQLNHVDLS